MITGDSLQEIYRETGAVPEGFQVETPTTMETTLEVDHVDEFTRYQARLNDPKLTAQLIARHTARGQWPPAAFAKPDVGPKTGHDLEARINRMHAGVKAYLTARREPEYMALDIIEAAIDRGEDYDEQRIGLRTWVNRIADEFIAGAVVDLHASVTT